MTTRTLKRVTRGIRRRFRRKVSFGDLRRIEPFCRDYGFSRGNAIDRHFIERFLETHQHDVKGRCLEIQTDRYTRRFGGQRVEKADVLDINRSNSLATIYDDLTKLTSIENDSFDCIIFTQTLHLLDDDAGALRQLYRTLRPGGTLLMTVPCISKVGRSDADGIWRRFYTEHGLSYLLKKYVEPSEFSVTCFGNLQLAAAFLYGLSDRDVDPRLFGHHDPEFPLIIASRVSKG